MTSREFSGVDPDLLADYVGGALDGTPEQATVARLIESDPAWGDAYAALARAIELVHADLADWAAAPAPELPLTVADRITAALAGAGPAPADATRVDAEEWAGAPGPGRREVGDGEPEAPHPAEARGATPVSVPIQPRRADGATRPAERPARNTGPGRRSRRWARIAGPVALAAVSVTAVGLGISHLVDTANHGVTSTADRAGSAAGRAQPEAAAAAPFRTAGPPQHSGTDYGPDQLPGSIMTLASPSAARGPGETAGMAPDDQRKSAGAGLERLARPGALASCLGAISAEHGAGLITLDLVDYASFQGRPALVVTFVDPSGTRWAWVSGAECGVPGSGADTRFRTRVG
ncbi:hypothetical protein ONA91_05155 [Micromonospora sp. DR5-3]|uniref:hypothetical protein n=1 Tax=unclassified Micromonospora TaxID=2617518 RepID=UPI0011D4549C|nr:MULTISPECIES: hypothetical protein [unclassified Micromonospora]MCW3813841.1 hypothetical protein [Micromonospora sp. DR5-3]TYC25483.1 hypothetical protein FXF52_03350 [Micromonospora sp. MP36]